MDYTPISARRVLLGFGMTAFVALFPALFLLLQSGHAGPVSLTFLADSDGSYRGLMLAAGSTLLTMFLIGALMLAVVVGRRIARRPSSA
jgi:hypothetical protein